MLLPDRSPNTAGIPGSRVVVKSLTPLLDRGLPANFELRPAGSGPAEFENGWQARLLTVNGRRLAVVANAITALQNAPEFEGVLWFDRSSYNTVAKAHPPWNNSHELPFRWTDDDDVRLAAWLQYHGIMVGKETAGQAAQTVAREHEFHPFWISWTH